MYSGADHCAARPDRCQGGRDQRTDGGIDDRGIQWFRGLTVRVTDPFGAQRQCEFGRGAVARAYEGEDSPALILGHLSDNMSGGSESIDTQALCLTRHLQ